LTAKATDNDNAETTSSAVNITVNPPAATPAAPGALIATAVSTSQINLSWTDNASNEQGFRIERSNNNVSFTQIATVGPNVTTYPSGGLQKNKTFYYRVRAYNASGNSAYTNTASAKTFK
jgi:predicted phage tail protein